MNITFLIGNGFDLNLGLNTKYSDFMAFYRRRFKGDTPLIDNFKYDITQNLNFWSDAELAFGRYTQNFNEGEAENFCLCHEDFCIQLANYLLGQEQRINYKKMQNHIIKNFSASLNTLLSGFRENQRQQIESSYKSIGGGYMYNFINFNYTSTLDSFIELINTSSSVLGIRRFNNTNCSNGIGEVRHIHGTVLSDMVLGLNDISQISNPAIFQNVSPFYLNQIIKVETNTMNEENNDSKTHTLLQKSDLIVIFGMSIGATDKLWWERICTLMKEKPQLHLILCCFDAPDEGLMRRNFLLFQEEKRDLFTSFCDLDDSQKQNIKQRIHIKKTNLFQTLENLVNNELNTAI